MRWEGRGQCEGERCSGDVGQQGATLVGDYPQGRECWMITRRVECLNGLFSVVSTSWQLLEHMEAEGATFGTAVRVGGRGKKSPGRRAAFLSLRGQRER